MLAVTWYAVCKQENQESWWFNLVQSGSGGPEIGELQCSEIQCWDSSLKGASVENFLSYTFSNLISGLQKAFGLMFILEIACCKFPCLSFML